MINYCFRVSPHSEALVVGPPRELQGSIIQLPRNPGGMLRPSPVLGLGWGGAQHLPSPEVPTNCEVTGTGLEAGVEGPGFKTLVWVCP